MSTNDEQQEQLRRNELRQLACVLDIYVVRKPKSTVPYWAYAVIPWVGSTLIGCGNTEEEAVKALTERVLSSMEIAGITLINRRTYAFPTEHPLAYLVDRKREVHDE